MAEVAQQKVSEIRPFRVEIPETDLRFPKAGTSRLGNNRNS